MEKIKTKKFKLIILALLLTIFAINSFSLSACKGEDTSEDTSNNNHFLYYNDKFMCGICHPPYGNDEDNAAVSLVSEANINWTRFDLSSLPYTKDENGNIPRDENGNIAYTSSYASFRNRCSFYAEQGLRVMAITPYPKVFFRDAYDTNTDVNEIPEETAALIKEYAAFYATDLKGIVQAFQITNEMGQSNFRRPFGSIDLAAEYIGLFAEAMHPITKENGIIIGYNVDVEAAFSLPNKMKPYSNSVDWVGLDLYLGCFDSSFHDISLFNLTIDVLHNATQKPIVLCEFGYINKGETKSEEERNAMLRQYGYENEAAVKEDIEGFIKAYKDKNGECTLVKETEARLYDGEGKPSNPTEAFEYLFNTDKAAHIYCEMSEDIFLTGYPHSKQGQADFFTNIIPALYSNKNIIGMFIYCFRESDSCYICHQTECPIETAWGLVTLNNTPNASYYAVQTQYGLIQSAEESK